MKFRSVMRTLILVAMAMSIGLHWALFQSVAWVGMMADYSRDHSLGEAVSMTFDGQHPCALCLAVEAGQKQEKDSGEDPLSPHDDRKLVLFLTAIESFGLPVISLIQRAVPYHGAARSDRAETPPVPPPQVTV
jgi:hypothetical protein